MYPFPLTPPEDQLSHPYELAFSKHDLSIVSDPPVASLTVIPVIIVSRSPILQMTLVVPTERVVFLVTPSSHWHAVVKISLCVVGVRCGDSQTCGIKFFTVIVHDFCRSSAHFDCGYALDGDLRRALD